MENEEYEEYEVKYNVKYCNEKYWQMGNIDIVKVRVPSGTKGMNHYSARLNVELDLQADRICEYKIVGVRYC